MVWILAEKSPGQLIGLCNIYLHESFGFRLMCGWYNRCSGGHFAFCPVAAETFCGRKKRHVVCLIWLIAPYADSPIGIGLSLLSVPHCEANVIYSNHQRPSWKKDLTLLNLHVLYSHHQQNVSECKVPKQHNFLLIACTAAPILHPVWVWITLPPLQFVAFVKFHIRRRSAIPQRYDQSIYNKT